MIDLAKWLQGVVHEKVEDLGDGVYRHTFTAPDVQTPRYTMSESELDHMLTLMHDQYFALPLFSMSAEMAVRVSSLLAQRFYYPVLPRRKLRKCHMRKIFKHHQMKRRRYGKNQ